MPSPALFTSASTGAAGRALRLAWSPAHAWTARFWAERAALYCAELIRFMRKPTT